MGYALIWLTYLGAALFLAAEVTALSSYKESPRGRYGWPLVTLIVVLLPAAALTLMAAFLRSSNVKPDWLFPYALSLALMCLLAAVIIIRSGLKTVDEKPAAQSWPRVGLGAAFVLTLAVNLALFLYMDHGVRAELAKIKSETTRQIKAILPAKPAEDQNSAIWYDQADKALGSYKELPPWFLDIVAPDFNPNTEKAAKFLSSKKDAIALLYQAGSRPGYYIDGTDPANLIQTPLIHYRKYRNLTNLLLLSSRYKILR